MSENNNMALRDVTTIALIAVARQYVHWTRQPHRGLVVSPVVIVFTVGYRRTMSNACVPDSVKCLDGVDYEVVKHNAHFEWVTEYENTIKQLSSEVFDTLGVNDGSALDIAVKGLDGFQGNLKSLMDALVKQVTDKSGVNERAKSFAAEWAEAVKYQVDFKYHHAGGGPSAKKVRWGFESAIKYIIVCATHLADEGGDTDFKKQVSGYVKDVIIQSLIDHLNGIKSELEALQKTS